MRRDVVLVGGSGLARETADAVVARGRHRVLGVLDDNARTWETDCGGYPVLGGLELVAKMPHVQLVLCVGKGVARRSIARRLARLGIDDGRYLTVVHPAAVVGASSSIGAGSILLARVVITADALVGRHVVVMPNVVVTHDDVVEDYATLCAGVTLAGGVLVGSAAYVGASAAIRENVRIGAGSTIGLGSVVVRDVPERQTWIGNPAHELVIPEMRHNAPSE